MVHRTAISTQRAISYVRGLEFKDTDSLPASTLLDWLSRLIELVADVHRERSSVACLHLPANMPSEMNSSVSLLAALACDIYGAAAVHVVCSRPRYAWYINAEADDICESLFDSGSLNVALSVDRFLRRAFSVPPRVLIIDSYNFMEQYVQVLEQFKCGAASPSTVILVGACSVYSCIPTLPHVFNCEEYKKHEPQLYLFEWNADCSSLELLKVYTPYYSI